MQEKAAWVKTTGTVTSKYNDRTHLLSNPNPNLLSYSNTPIHSVLVVDVFIPVL
jgi:hypothetical protein